MTTRPLSTLPTLPTLPTLVLVVAVALAAQMAQAQSVYKWTDEKGVVNYTTTPPSSRKAAVVDVAPAVAAQALPADYDEARYWRERSQREAASELALERMRIDTENLRQARLRQEIAASEAAAQQKSAAQRAIDQCRSERRVDCESTPLATAGYGPSYYGPYGASPYPYPQVVVVNRRPTPPAPTGPYFSVTSRFTPGFSLPLVYSNPR